MPLEEIGNYKITKKLGEGGMGAVYLAEHKLIGRQAAIKVLLPELCTNEEIVSRFFNEAKATTRINHPGIVAVFDFGHHEGSAFIVMEYLDGESLTARMKRVTRMGIGEAIGLARQMAKALGAAHELGIVHRDLKPDNIFLVPNPEKAGSERIKILDFGIAKLQASSTMAPSAKTRTGSVMGTPMYMSPEQCRGLGGIDQRTDIYSLGCVLFQMVCGRPPYVSESVGDLLGSHIYQEAPKPSEIDGELPPAVDEIIGRLLKKKPEERPETMALLVAELDAAFPRGKRDQSQLANLPKLIPGKEKTGPIVPSKDPVIVTAPTQAAIPDEARKTPTTLSASVGEGKTVIKKRAKLAVQLGVAVGLVGIAAGVVVVVVSSRGSAPAATPLPAAAVAPRPDAQPPPPPPPPPVTPLAAEKIHHRIVTTPTGADVFRYPDLIRLGATPFDTELEPGVGQRVYLVTKIGYEDGRVELAMEKGGDASLVLVKRGGAVVAPPVTPAKKRDAAPVPVNDDDLLPGTQ